MFKIYRYKIYLLISKLVLHNWNSMICFKQTINTTKLKQVIELKQ